MPTMKVTPDAAMRARDVSRPRAQHLAWAEEAAASATAGAGVADEAGVFAGTGAAVETSAVAGTGVADEAAGERGRRVRGNRSSSRRGRPSR